jgi:rubredoxin
MVQELDHACLQCGTERTFYRTASTNLHLGLKTKWSCPECDYRFVQIDGDIDSSAQA